MHVRHKTQHQHIRRPLPLPQLGRQSLVPAADHHDLPRPAKPVVQRDARLLHGSHPVPAPDNENRAQIPPHPKPLPQPRLVVWELGEGWPDRQAVHHQLLLAQPPPLSELLRLHGRYEALVDALVEPSGMAGRVVGHHRGKRDFPRPVLLLLELPDGRQRGDLKERVYRYHQVGRDVQEELLQIVYQADLVPREPDPLTPLGAAPREGPPP
mmetsp:Transcript_10541/g.37410  ORF Transcript_10541/g.37410 Transcript_10541/m.37410 type:complete len:211 (+) Transcript_10541:2780-3412(+)